jgi:type 1 fimbriae regulatory protein FimB/type 1 fimbriae regulatory protein FimE
MLRRLQRQQYPKSSFVFTSERGTRLLSQWWRGWARQPASTFRCTRIQLRHACGYALANRGTDTRTQQAYLGHKNIQHTVRYTELAPTRFRDLWTD